MSEPFANPQNISPLEELEQLALEVANERNLSPEAGEADEQLREILRELVAQWRADFRRGIRSIDLTEPDFIVDRAMSNLTGYGPLESLLEDDDVWEIMLNAPAETMQDHAEAGDELDDETIAAYWRVLIDANTERLIEPGNPDLIMPGQEIVLPPISRGAAG